MPVFESTIDTNSAEYKANREAMLTLVDEMRGLEAGIVKNSARSKTRFEQRGQLLPRERMALLLDRGAPFLELSTLAGYKTFDDDGEDNITGGRQICGIGYVSGVRCMVAVHDSGIKAGSIHVMGLRKLLRAHKICLENKLPFVQLVHSAGADLLGYEPETFIRGGEMFFNMSRLSAAGLPVITVVHGASTAGGAYMPGLSDYVVMVRKQSKAFLAGSPLVKAATGEIADDESLGGADMHATISGLTEYLVDDDAEALSVCRDIVARLNWENRGPQKPAPDYAEPLYDIDELCGIVPVDYRKPFDVREIIARLVDGSDFLDFKPLFDEHTICGHGAIMGQPVGILGNNGPITPHGANKGAQFIQLCCQSNTPLLFLQNTTGFIVGTEPEQSGMIKHGSKMVQAVSNATVPKLTLMVGASFGAGNYGMCGRAYEPRFLMGWPNYRLAVMGADQAATTMAIVQEAVAKRKGRELDEENLESLKEQVRQRYQPIESALYHTARLSDDGLIDPRDSRMVIGQLLSIVGEAAAREVHPNSFGVARF
jgi:geranyl-CoA carboxylase beta subunit